MKTSWCVPGTWQHSINVSSCRASQAPCSISLRTLTCLGSNTSGVRQVVHVHSSGFWGGLHAALLCVLLIAKPLWVRKALHPSNQSLFLPLLYLSTPSYLHSYLSSAQSYPEQKLKSFFRTRELPLNPGTPTLFICFLENYLHRVLVRPTYLQMIFGKSV